MMNVLAFCAPKHEVTQVFLTGTLLNAFFSKKGIFTYLAAVIIVISRQTFLKIKEKKRFIVYYHLRARKVIYLLCSHLDKNM